MQRRQAQRFTHRTCRLSPDQENRPTPCPAEEKGHAVTVPTKSSWHPASSFGWIDIDRDEAKRVREMLGMLTTPEAIDPHGILPLQIALSERLFPGMSTQHTRARYVMFAAWHAQRLAVHRSARTPHEQLRVDEVGLMRSLLDSTDNAGVFGRRNREKTKTLPTSVYWGLLQKWKIIAPDLTIADISSQIDTAHDENADSAAMTPKRGRIHG